MKFNFKTHAYIDVSSIKRKALEYTKDNWDSYDYRQKTFDVHKQTKTIPLLWDEKVQGRPKSYNEINKYQKELLMIHTLLTNKIGLGYMATAMLINLPSKKIISRHKDVGYFFAAIHRIHIPIVTDPKCIFTIEEEKRNLQEGEVVEIDNNDKYHSVENNSDIDRIHLLIDWLDKDNDLQHKT
tara:strand:+ start:2797 stop:3345 length:549 start_codon:yes stop_codon:yes gene_type:complete